MQSQMLVLLKKLDRGLAQGSLSQFKLGEIKSYGSLVPSSQTEGLPFYSVHSGTPAQRQNAREALMALAQKVDLRINGQPYLTDRLTRSEVKLVDSLFLTYQQ